MKKLKQLLSEENKIQLNESWSEEETNQLTTEDKRAFLESVSKFNSYGKSIYREADFKSMTEEIGSLIETAKTVALNEGDWFDGVTVGRHMKSLGESYKMFEKTAKEMNVLQQRMEAVYEEIGGTLNKYFDIQELVEELDPVGKADGDIDNDGDEDESDEYLINRRKTISKAMSNEQFKLSHQNGSNRNKDGYKWEFQVKTPIKDKSIYKKLNDGGVEFGTSPQGMFVMGNSDADRVKAIQILNKAGITESKLTEAFEEFEITYDNNNVSGKKIKKGTKVKVKARNAEEAHRKAAKKLVGDEGASGMLKTMGRIKKTTKESNTVHNIVKEEVSKMLGQINNPKLRAKLATKINEELSYNTVNESLVKEATGFDAKALLNLIKDDKFLGHVFKTKYKGTPITQALIDIWKNYVQGDNELEQQYKLA